MNEKQLREQLRQLADTVDHLHAAPQEKDQLNDLIADIERQLNEQVLNPPSTNLTEQVETLVSRFEVKHPTVASILNNIMVTLSSMGV